MKLPDSCSCHLTSLPSTGFSSTAEMLFGGSWDIVTPNRDGHRPTFITVVTNISPARGITTRKHHHPEMGTPRKDGNFGNCAEP